MKIKIAILRCTWCCRDTKTNPCEHCGSDSSVVDRTEPHNPHWSRRTMRTVDCKVCDREVPNSEQGKPGERCFPEGVYAEVKLTKPQLKLMHDLAAGENVSTSYKPLAKLLELGLAFVKQGSLGETVKLTTIGREALENEKAR